MNKNYNNIFEFKNEISNNEISNNNLDIDVHNDFIIGDDFENSEESFSYFNDMSESTFDMKNKLKFKQNFTSENHKILTQSENNLLELEIFESKIPKEISKEKKMSLLIVVLLQMIFKNNHLKLEKIYDFLNEKNLLDLEVTTKNYTGLRKSLSMLIDNANISPNTDSETISVSNSNSKINYETNFNYHEMNLNKTFDKNSINPINKYKSNFNQIKLLGQGSYGSVYKVFHKFEKKFYAIKKIFITKDLIEDNYDIFREIQIYSELDNNNIVRYYGSWVDVDLSSILEYNSQIQTLNQYESEDCEIIDYICPILFIQMELCDFTLKDYLLTWSKDDKPINKINILIQIISGLEYLKTKNIIHRDIKPDNIFLLENEKTGEYNVKLGDFGLCKKYTTSHEHKYKNKHNSNSNLNSNLNNLIISDIKNNLIKDLWDTSIILPDQLEKLILENSNSSMGSNVGTGIYRAPEISNGIYDYAIDTYSLGIIILELFMNFITQSEKINLIIKLKKKIESINSENKTQLNFNLDFGLDSESNLELTNIILSSLNPNPILRMELSLIKTKLINMASFIDNSSIMLLK